MNLWQQIIYYLSVLPVWTKLTFHNTWGILNVVNIVWLRPMKGGMVNDDHPLVTGINPETEKYIWHENVVFKTERTKEYSKTDKEIIEATGQHLCSMMAKSCANGENDSGTPDRMPPAINYIHGGIQYNGGFFLFNDIKEAISYFSNKYFQKEFRRFINVEKREPITILREKDYDRQEFLEFVCFLRTIFPYFSNSNGNKKRIGWGNPAPYPSVNTITGHWKTDTYKLYHSELIDSICRSPIKKDEFFQADTYLPVRNYTLFPEKFLAKFTDNRVIARGEKGNVFFVDRRKLNKGYKFNPEDLQNIVGRLIEKIGLSQGA